MKRALVVTTLMITIKGFLVPHIKHLEEMGYQVDLACNMKHGFYIEELKENKWHHLSFTRNPFSINNLKSIAELQKIIRKRKYDMVHLHTPIAAFLGRFAAHTLGIKNIIYTAHGFHFYRGAPFINWLIYYPLEWVAMRWTDKIITINQEDFSRARRMAGNKTKVYKIDGVGLNLKKYSEGNREKVRKEFQLSEKDFVVTIIGELNKNKNKIQLIKAIEILEAKFKVLIVGNGPKEAELKEYVNLKGLEDRVKFLGIRMDINDIIAASEVMVSMSYREGLPRNIMEGLAQGKPFVATNIRGNKDIIENNKNGYLVKVNDYIKTSKVIKKLEDKEIYRTMKEYNIEEVKKYSIHRILKEMEIIYRD